MIGFPVALSRADSHLAGVAGFQSKFSEAALLG
jgi:hypothetical protein